MATISIWGTWEWWMYVFSIQFKVKYCWLPYCCNSIQVPERPKQLHSVNSFFLFFFFLNCILYLKFSSSNCSSVPALPSRTHSCAGAELRGAAFQIGLPKVSRFTIALPSLPPAFNKQPRSGCRIFSNLLLHWRQPCLGIKPYFPFSCHVFLSFSKERLCLWGWCVLVFFPVTFGNYHSFNTKNEMRQSWPELTHGSCRPVSSVLFLLGSDVSVLSKEIISGELMWLLPAT